MGGSYLRIGLGVLRGDFCVSPLLPPFTSVKKHCLIFWCLFKKKKKYLQIIHKESCFSIVHKLSKLYDNLTRKVEKYLPHIS